MTTIDLLAEPRAITPATITRTEVATATPKLPSIKETVLAQFREAESTVTALAEKYRAVAYDCTTAPGMAAAKAARMELREKGRYAVQRAETAVKADVNDLKRVMSDEVERLVAIVRPVEDHVDGQIKAREATLAAEKAERERIAAEAAAKEAARVQMHRDNIARIRGYVAQAQGADAARLQRAVTFLGTINPGDEYEEFAAEAQQAVADTVSTLGRMLAEATEREAEAARVRAQAAENARVAAELAEQKRQLDEQAAALKKQQDEAEAQRVAAEKAEAQSLADSIRTESRRVEWPKNPAYIRKAMGTFECMAPDWENDPRQVVREAIAEGRQYLADLLASADKPAILPATVAYIAENGSNTEQVEAQYAKQVAAEIRDMTPAPCPAEPQPEPTITLGQLGELLGFDLRESFITNSLKISPVFVPGRAKHYRRADIQTLRERLVAHINLMLVAT